MRTLGDKVNTEKQWQRNGESDISIMESSEWDGMAFLSIQLNLEAGSPVFDFLLLGFLREKCVWRGLLFISERLYFGGLQNHCRW